MLNSGSRRMVRHLPGPCLATPALSAASSSGVHRCFGAPIAATNREAAPARGSRPQAGRRS
uniref:Uncharacterized protein n=1 Tax=Arundo donax TaxID=35708 RepID=A0A0A9F8E2_ARUDO